MTTPTPRTLSFLETLPTELIGLITDAQDSQGHNLSKTDLGNLRLASRRMQQATFQNIAKRAHTTHKFMLSRASIQYMLEIGNDEYASPYVREIAIGPERLNPNFEALLEDMDEKVKEHWLECFKPVYDKLVKEQQEFVTSGDMSRMLSEAFVKFPNLERVRLDSYPLDPVGTYNDATITEWTVGWGASSLLQEIGYTSQYIY
ncbi:hypothetical protein IAQ61_004822 [Plenodomus lingam]|uniref:Predicted protein n=1 Tax=Leptosphaeria maculans (strain JN3 / isolate v23.1.3 / race Av1-4-5-6-7-8) TaxID=985895 RepID=E4ZWM5_LEPMJ|nr:predicted protein [Plenodomus lingam JN3]KAH9874193.1 hypothetical protein IAQ61_004822 [Plenodomus lingam]CBX96001.1 predicted protein [Plenodomus lingam JN3]